MSGNKTATESPLFGALLTGKIFRSLGGFYFHASLLLTVTFPVVGATAESAADFTVNVNSSCGSQVTRK